ncbi:YihA family ribosome biogenesis GTP-binding protein [candidate division KSB1 bacterium]|nr:YihA family ribosome biogenesis GTP-binding protein [candidate division KSB1 bacterium]
MKVISADFIKSIATIEQIPAKNLPEIAFAGRSNVGKSSLINCMLNRKKLAMTSSTPGKTRLINFYEVNGTIYFVDLPGYGYARISQQERHSWKKLIENYILQSINLKGVIHIIDSRIGPTHLDLEMIRWLNFIERPVVVVATKADKLPRSKLQTLMHQYQKTIQEIVDLPLLTFSAVNKYGKQELWHQIGKLSSL